MKHSDVQVDIAAANDKWSLKVAKPLSEDDWKVDGSLAVEHKIGKSQKGNLDLGIDSPDMSGTKLNMNLGLEHEKKPDDKGAWNKQATTIKFDMCANVEKDYFIGAAIEHDTKELAGASMGVSKQDDGNCYWLGYNHGDKFVNAGCRVHNADANFTHAYEAKYYMDKDHQKKFYDQPVKLAFAGKYQLNKATGFGYSLECGAFNHAQAKWEHKVDKNWKVSAHQSYDMAQKNKPYNLGFDVAYTL